MTKKTDAVKDAAQDLDQDLVEVTVAPRRSVVGHNGRAVGPGNEVRNTGMVCDRQIPIRHHRPTPVPAPLPHDVNSGDVERIGGPHD